MPGLEDKYRQNWKMAGTIVRKLGILVLAGLLATLLFFPNLLFTGFSYSAGDVATTDVRSPVRAYDAGVSVMKGETVVREGQVITEHDLAKLRLIESSVQEAKDAVPASGFFFFVLVILLSAYILASKNIKKFASSTKDLLLMVSVFAGVLLLLRLSDTAALVMRELAPGPTSVYRFIVPVAVGPMLIRLLLNTETALVFAAVTSIVAGYFTGGVEMAAYSFTGGMVAAAGVKHCTHRSIVIKAGIMLALANVAALLCITAIKGGSVDLFSLAMTGVVNGVLTAVLAIGIAPVLESIFQYTTDIRLLELSRMDHQLLKELAIKAPGTYHHSLIIGTLAEAAAESISANPLLARVGAYYHDIGKMKMPQYFVENSSEDRHGKLTASMSALVITSHVKEGVEMAKKHRLGSAIADIIGQHHGTALVSFFYQKARNEGADSEVIEGNFRYGGPKPQTKEAGIVMLADAIEAASKTLSEHTPDRIQWLTQKIVNKIFSDGQLDDCELTLKDLHAITRSFNKVFEGMHHQRVDYPEPVDVLKEKGFESTGAGKRQHEDQKNGRDRIKRLGV
ncbi:MAG: HDIG domain-containing protein [Deltaproteobacteria bacterium]|nr:HDIG domain-containing protein [Deltaproteobacteria bacterium]